MTKEQAVALSETRFWEEMTIEQRAAFQLFEDRLCMPFDVFHEAVEQALKRPVWTHEFADQEALRKEFLGDKSAPTMQEIIEMIPAEKRIIILRPLTP